MQNLTEVFKMYRGLSNVLLYELFTLDENSKGTKGHSCQLVKTQCTTDITKYFFSNKVINRWNLLDQWMVDAASISAFASEAAQGISQSISCILCILIYTVYVYIFCIFCICFI